MTVDLESFTLTVDDPFSFLWGMWEGSNDSGSMSPQDSQVVYPGGIFRGVFYHPGDDEFYLQMYGLHQNSGWDVIEVNGTNFSRSSATYTVYWVNDITRPSGSSPLTFKGPFVEWVWTSISSNPFPTTVGATVTVKFKQNGHVPGTGQISLNQIHQEAGGSSGTQASINDSDIRAKSWHAVVEGSTPASGVQQDFADFYWPTHLNDTTVLRRCPSTAASTTDLNTYRAAYVSIGDIHTYGTVQSYTNTVSFTIEQDGTDTTIHIKPSTSSGYTEHDGAGDGSTVTNRQTVFTVDGFAATHVALYSQNYVSVDSKYGSNSTFVHSTNYNPESGATYISNSSTSFTAMSANTKYGRSSGAIRSYEDNAQTGFYNSDVYTRYDVYLRKQPDGSKCFLDKVVSFAIRLNVIDSVEGGG